MQGGLSHERNVCLFVRPSVKRANCDKMKETCAHILIPHERPFILVFWQKEVLLGATPSTWNFGSNWPCWSENADIQSIFASASVVTPSEKSSIIIIYLFIKQLHKSMTGDTTWTGPTRLVQRLQWP